MILEATVSIGTGPGLNRAQGGLPEERCRSALRLAGHPASYATVSDPGSFRDFVQQEGVISARTLILDLLGTGEAARYETAKLVRAGAAFGISAVGVRTAITRLAVEGRIRQVARGIYVAGPLSEPLQRHLRNWRNAAARRVQWKGAWLLAVAGAIDRADRTLWRRTVRALETNGLNEAEPGVWVRPDNLRGGAEHFRERLADFGYAETLLIVSASNLDSGRDKRYRQLWDTARLQASLESLAEDLRRHRPQVETQEPRQAAVETLLNGRSAIRRIVRDPLLPVEMCSVAALDKLIAEMRDYDQAGRAAWRRYLGEG